MPSDFAQWAALFGMIAMLVIFLMDMRKWYLPNSVVAPKQRGIRIALFAIIELLLVMWLIGARLGEHINPWITLYYWVATLILGAVVILLVILDLREVGKQYSRISRQVSQSLREDNEHKN
jgi:glycerol uptake facilitator-like aquaporin